GQGSIQLKSNAGNTVRVEYRSPTLKEQTIAEAGWVRADGPDILTCIERCEAASRTSWLEILKKTGLTAPGLPPAGAASVPAEVEASLAEMELIEQYTAVRRLHALVRDKGESSSLIG